MLIIIFSLVQRQTGNTTSDNDRELVNNDDTSFVTQTESTSNDNDHDEFSQNQNMEIRYTLI